MDETSAASTVQHRDVAERATQEEVVPLQSSIVQRVGHQQQAPQHLQHHQEHQEHFEVLFLPASRLFVLLAVYWWYKFSAAQATSMRCV